MKQPSYVDLSPSSRLVKAVVEGNRLYVIQREMWLAHKNRNAWATVAWLAPKARVLRTEFLFEIENEKINSSG